MLSLDQPESRLPSVLAVWPEHDFDGGIAATAGLMVLIARRSEPSQCGGAGGEIEQPTDKTEASANAATRIAASSNV
jgi:hypothetical protein